MYIVAIITRAGYRFATRRGTTSTTLRARRFSTRWAAEQYLAYHPTLDAVVVTA